MTDKGKIPFRPIWAVETDDSLGRDGLLGFTSQDVETTKAILNKWGDIYSRNLRSVYHTWMESKGEACEFRVVTGAPSDETRERALTMLAQAQRLMGADKLEVCRYLSVGLNYRIDENDPIMVQRFNRRKAEFYTEKEMQVRYTLIFELYMHMPVLFGTARLQTASHRLFRDKAVAVKDPRNGRFADVLIGEISLVDMDIERDTGRIVAHDLTGGVFDVTFTLDGQLLMEDEHSRYVREWMDSRIVDDMTR